MHKSHAPEGAANRLIAAGLGLGAIAWMGWTILSGPGLRAERAAQLAAEIAEENRETCDRLGLGPDRGGLVFGACARELDAVRRRQDARPQSPFL